MDNPLRDPRANGTWEERLKLLLEVLAANDLDSAAWIVIMNCSHVKPEEAQGQYDLLNHPVVLENQERLWEAIRTYPGRGEAAARRYDLPVLQEYWLRI